MRVALYVRVSTEEQKNHGISVDAQIKALTDYSEENNHTIVDIYNDAGISARKSYKKRPELLRMIKDCQAGKVDLILICKLDRFFRSVPDYYAVIEQLNGVPWKAIHEDYETLTANGVFKVNIMLSVAQSEADRTGERIRHTFEYKKAKGEVCTGGVATGYVIKNKRWYIDKNAEPGIRAFYDDYFKTYSLKHASMAAREKGLNVTYVIGRKLLNAPCYYGDEVYVAEPYITREQHEQIVKHKKGRPARERKYDYIFNGLVRCGVCGGSVSISTHPRQRKDGSVYINTRYCCGRHEHFYDCTGCSISEKNLEAFMIKSIDGELKKYNISVKTVPQDSHTNDIKNCRAKLNRLKDLYELGDIEFSEYKEKRSALLNQIDSYHSSASKPAKQLPSNWIDIYNELDKKHKRTFWSELIDHIELDSLQCKEPVIFF